MASTIQRDTTFSGLKLWLSLFTHRTQTATKSLPIFELDITVSYVGHTFQTCHVMTSDKCVQLTK